MRRFVWILVAACGGTQDTTIDITHDPCAGVALDGGTTEIQRGGLDAALRLWRDGGVALDRAEPATISVLFQPASQAFRGLYDDERGIILVNDSIEEPAPLAEEAASATDEARAPSRREVPPEQGLSPELEPEAMQPSAPERIDKPLQSPDTAARAEQEFRRGMQLFRGGRTDEAEAAWRAALDLDPAAAAPRQALLGALLERGERERAETLLQEGLRMNPRQPKQIMLLARLQLDRGAQTEALRTLEQGLPHAQWNAEYLSMTAAVMSRVGRHRDAAELYASALRVVPGNAVWEMGRGMALRADGQREQALAAFQRASRLPGLSPELRAFVERQIRELQ